MERRRRPAPSSLFATPYSPFAPLLLAIRPLSLLHRLRRRLHRHDRLLHRLRIVGGGGGVEIIDEFRDARGVAAEVAVEIARGGADIDARVLAVRRDADRDVLAEPHDRGARHRLDAADAARRLWRPLVDHLPLALVHLLLRDLIVALDRA